jgi:hypothetical protein
MISKRILTFALQLVILVLLPRVVFCQSAVAPAPEQPLTLQQYIAELDRCSAVLANSGSDSTALHKLRVSLPAKWTVNAGDQNFSVTTDWLYDDVARIEGDPRGNADLLQRAKQRLAEYRASAQAFATAAPTQDVASSRAKLNEILGAREFQSIRGPSWFEIQRARLYSWIARHLENLFGHLGHGRAIANVVAWTAIALVALVLLLWLVRASIRSGAQAKIDLRGASAAGQDWHYWLREARAAASRGDYRAAIHAAYWAAVARLEETNSLPEDRSRTPRESLRLIRRESAAYAPLSQLTRRFELVWYGYRAATDADWADAMQQLETLGCLRSSTPAISGS